MPKYDVSATKNGSVPTGVTFETATMIGAVIGPVTLRVANVFDVEPVVKLAGAVLKPDAVAV